VVAGSHLTETQRRILIALARPFIDGHQFATPATNREIAAEVCLSVDAVKGHLRLLFKQFGLDELPQNRKRAALSALAVSSGCRASDPPRALPSPR
jgi:hypothetical protein